MKPNELRTGNLISVYMPISADTVQTIEVGIVDIIDSKYEFVRVLNHNYPLKYISGINLSLEWIRQFHFKPVRENIYEYSWNKIKFRIERLAGCYWLKSSAGTTESKPLKYVHELQNLFHALHGEELTLKQ